MRVLKNRRNVTTTTISELKPGDAYEFKGYSFMIADTDKYEFKLQENDPVKDRTPVVDIVTGRISLVPSDSKVTKIFPTLKVFYEEKTFEERE